MKLFILLCALCAIGGMNTWAQPVEEPSSVYSSVFKLLHREPPLGDSTENSRAEDQVEINWIEQKLDNFDESNTDTWQMRYISNSGYYQTGGPLFIYVGAEWTINTKAVTRGHTFEMAKKHNGYIFYTEHRYYGESHPTEDLSVDNMKYLDVRQALADLAHFVRTMKSTIPGAENSKVIMAGGSYAATMTTWFAKLYPELVSGSWASSGPLLAKTDFIEYKEVVGQSIYDVGGKTCYDRVQNSFEQLQNMFKNNRVAEVKSMFKLCNSFNENNDMDVWNFFNLVTEVFSGIVQYAYPGDIEKTCSYFDGKSDDYISLAKYILTQLPSKTCLDMSYKNTLLELMEPTYTGGSSRQWTYQTCNEFGWYQSSDSKNQPFGNKFPIDYFITMCGDLFGEKFTRSFVDEQVQKTNEMFGALNPGVESVYFTQGSLDPWKAMGINNNTIGQVIPLASHCMDLSASSSSQNTYLRASNNKISALVAKWLQED